MSNGRAYNSKRNLAFGVISKIVTLVLPFLLRTILIEEMGANYLGLNGLFTSILSVLNVAELGFSSAITYSMYRPIANNDIPAINALLKLYRTIYNIIGAVIFVLGVCLLPFLPFLVKAGVPSDINLFSLYLIYLVNSSISYFTFSYYRSLLSAFQREDILSKITIYITAIQNILQAVLVFVFHNYYVYVLVLPIMSILGNLLIAYAARKNFPQCKCEGKITAQTKNEIIKNMKGLVIAKVGGVSRNAFDSIFISAFLGLVEVAKYNNYYYISSAITGMMVLIHTAIMASIGNSVAVETKENNYSTMKKLNFLYMWIGGWFSICLLCLYQPFMKIWVGEAMLLPTYTMVLFCLYFYSLKLGDIQSLYLTTAGLFYEFRNCAIIQSVANIALNYFLGKFWGIDGIISATMISILCVDFLYGNQIVFKHYFGRDRIKEYFATHVCYFAATMVAAAITIFISRPCGFILRIVICCIIPNLVYVLLYHRQSVYQISICWALDMVGLNKSIIKKILMLENAIV